MGGGLIVSLVKEVIGPKRNKKVDDSKWPTCIEMIMNERDGEKLFHKKANEILLSRCPWGEAIMSDAFKEMS